MHDFDRIQTNMRQRMRSMLRGMLNDGTTLPRGIFTIDSDGIRTNVTTAEF